MHRCFLSFFFFNDTATTEIYTLSLHDALPIFPLIYLMGVAPSVYSVAAPVFVVADDRTHQRVLVQIGSRLRSEEHTSELQSRQYLVCRLLLEKKKKAE